MKLMGDTEVGSRALVFSTRIVNGDGDNLYDLLDVFHEVNGGVFYKKLINSCYKTSLMHTFSIGR